jgi:hypothetical protein
MRRNRALTISFCLCLLCVESLGAQTRPAREVLPEGHIRQAYYQQFTPPQGTPPWHWRLVDGTLPPGIALEPAGILAGAPTAPGEFRFTLQAADSSPKPIVHTRDYLLTVPSPLTIQWTQPPQVTANGAIAGELQVANGTGRTFDLTIIVVAVNSFNKAFALGYQHSSFGPGSQRVPFGSALPRDVYVVHADAIAENADTYEIYRARLQSGPLAVQ